jgi:hypothetical protein
LTTSSSLSNIPGDRDPGERQPHVIELFIEKEECMQAKLSCSAIANKPQQVVEFIRDILEVQIVVPMFLWHLN